ncbi:MULTISPECIES: P1 family peptidase [Rhodomicrobium]|uniref:P1 family peptidase n=1 Tax=Rhodomicrobium TaxID=1068 RepID=UPI000B4B9E19|nr:MULTISPECIES: P1 family peptidase [Rhodomicrobium]
MNWRPGPRNLITDVPGITVGQAQDAGLRSGVTVILPAGRARGAADIRGGGPGTRETETMTHGGLVNELHGLVFSGGSAFGLDAATGVQSFLREQGAGFAVGAARVPIVPQAILFDLLNGGDKDWGRHSPYRDMAYQAATDAAEDFALGTAGAGFGAAVAWAKSGQRMMGGIGSASLIRDDGLAIGALAAVNAAGAVTIGDTPHFWAAPFEIGGEFGGLGLPAVMKEEWQVPVLKAGPMQNTTLAVIATNAALTNSELRRLAIMAQTGMARAIVPVHTPVDGDIAFALSVGDHPMAAPPAGLIELGAYAANTLARAIARGVYEAGGIPGASDLPAYRDVFPRKV